ncbi:MAG TPA: 4-alpha-glucanotransferase, partial [Terracidiphilus sp.]
MEFERSAGVLLHVSSLPSRGPIGDLGPAAHEFVSFLAAGKQHIWQVLPLSPTGYGNS